MAEAVENKLPPLPEAKEVSSLLPDGMGLDVLRQARIVPLRIVVVKSSNVRDGVGVSD